MKPLQTFRAVTRKFYRKFSFSSFDRSNTLFDWWSRNWIAIESSRDSRIIFLIILIDWAKVRIDRIYWILNFHFIDFKKQYYPNSNIIITTYPYIYIYIPIYATVDLCVNSVIQSQIDIYANYSKLCDQVCSPRMSREGCSDKDNKIWPSFE